MHTTLQPFLFKDNNKKIYIIQNVSNGSKYIKNGKKIAMEIAYVWKTTKENIGAGSISSFTYPQKIKYVSYEIVSDNGDFRELVGTESNRNDESEYLQIILYNGGNYAAMLELL